MGDGGRLHAGEHGQWPLRRRQRAAGRGAGGHRHLAQRTPPGARRSGGPAVAAVRVASVAVPRPGHVPGAGGRGGHRLGPPVAGVLARIRDARVGGGAAAARRAAGPGRTATPCPGSRYRLVACALGAGDLPAGVYAVTAGGTGPGHQCRTDRLRAGVRGAGPGGLARARQPGGQDGRGLSAHAPSLDAGRCPARAGPVAAPARPRACRLAPDGHRGGPPAAHAAADAGPGHHPAERPAAPGGMASPRQHAPDRRTIPTTAC